MAYTLTTHNGKEGASGVYSSKHNDRNFNYEKDEHIDSSRTPYNKYFNFVGGQNFEEGEKQFYHDFLGKGLTARADRCKKDGHPERAKTIEQYRRSSNCAPIETIFTIGDMEDWSWLTNEALAAGGVDGKLRLLDLDTLMETMDETFSWLEQKYPDNIKILNVALHVDEVGGPHIHVRKSFFGHDDDGNPIPNQAMALREMGIERPYLDEEKGRWNNPGMTLSAMVREKAVEIAQSKGLEIEIDPKEVSQSKQRRAKRMAIRDAEAKLNAAQATGDVAAIKDAEKDLESAKNIKIEKRKVSGRTMLQYQKDKTAEMEAKNKVLVQDNARLETANRELTEKNESLNMDKTLLTGQFNDLKKSVDEKNIELDGLNVSIASRKEVIETLKGEEQALRADVNGLEGQKIELETALSAIRDEKDDAEKRKKAVEKELKCIESKIQATKDDLEVFDLSSIDVDFVPDRKGRIQYTHEIESALKFTAKNKHTVKVAARIQKKEKEFLDNAKVAGEALYQKYVEKGKVSYAGSERTELNSYRKLEERHPEEIKALRELDKSQKVIPERTHTLSR